MRAASTIALMTGAERISETSVYFNETTEPYIPEGCHLHTRSPAKLNSHLLQLVNVNGLQTVTVIASDRLQMT
jgi:hypothetical protein